MSARYVGVVIGVWYVTAPLLWGYTEIFNWWHSAVVGGAVVALSASFFVSPGRIAAWLLVATGFYSMFAPSLHGYLHLPFPHWNDLVFGAFIVGVGAALGAAAIRLAEEEEAGAGGGPPAAESTPRPGAESRAESTPTWSARRK